MPDRFPTFVPENPFNPIMKTLKTTFAALALCGLAACTAPAPKA